MSRIAAALFLSFVVLGCSGKPDDGPDLAPTSGIVTLDGEPVVGASITFQPKDGRRGASGNTNDEGRFEIAYITSLGCPPGECAVSISTKRQILNEYGGVAGLEPETIPEKYRGMNSELTATVVSGENNEFTFELKSDGKKIEQL